MRGRKISIASIAICIPLTGHATESIPIVPQNAGELIFKSEKFSLHKRTGYYHVFKRDSGPAHCVVSNKGSKHEYSNFHVTAIINKGKKFNVTQKWLWDNFSKLTPELAKKHCPEAAAVAVTVYIKGFDVFNTGHVYNTDTTPLPRLQNPALKEQNVTSAGTNFTNWKANDYIDDFVSDGIVQAWFRGLGKPTYSCNHPQNRVACSYDKFAPAYRYEKKFVPSSREMRFGRFDDLVEYKKRLHEKDLKIQAEEARKAKKYMRDYKKLQRLKEIYKKEGFWGLLARAHKRKRTFCDDPGNNCDYYYVQDVPILLL